MPYATKIAKKVGFAHEVRGESPREARHAQRALRRAERRAWREEIEAEVEAVRLDVMADEWEAEFEFEAHRLELELNDAWLALKQTLVDVA